MAEPLLALLGATAAGLAADAVLQALLARTGARDAPLRIQFAAFGAGLALTLVLLLALLADAPFALRDKIGYFLLHMLAYGCFGFIFFNVISANVSSLRVRMLKEYLARHPEPIPDAQMYARYPAPGMVAARLERLQAGGQVEARDGRYYLRGRGVAAIGAVFAGLRRLLLGGGGA